MDTLTQGLFNLFIVGFKELLINLPKGVLPPFFPYGVEDSRKVVGTAEDDLIIFSDRVYLVIGHFAEFND
jgi:hypothetical protein